MATEKTNSQEDKFRFIFETIDVANALTEPLIDSIGHLLRISATEMNSAEASVIIRDGNDGDLKFLSAIGEVADQLADIKIPAGKGIAGFVFSSGQPMALTEVGEEASFYAEVDKKTGYTTKTILATPLRYNGETVGVLEYVNRRGKDGYTLAEMDKAALFAEAFAALVNAYEAAKIFQGLSEKILSGDDEINFEQVHNWLKDLPEMTPRKEMIDLTLMVREIAARGDAERRMCLEILQTILRYIKGNSETNFLNGGW